jgi:hypothetical protein
MGRALFEVARKVGVVLVRVGGWHQAINIATDDFGCHVAEDTLCRIDRSGRGLVIEDLRTGTRLPAPEGWRETAPGITCRLVRFRGLHVPLDTMPVDDPSDPWNLASLDEAAEAAGQFLDHLDLKLRSRFKGVAIGEEVLEMALGDDDAEGTEDEDARGGGRGSHA